MRSLGRRQREWRDWLEKRAVVAAVTNFTTVERERLSKVMRRLQRISGEDRQEPEEPTRKPPGKRQRR
jgi:hypothetical protein